MTRAGIYGKYLLIDVYGNNGCATIECDPSSGSGSGCGTVYISRDAEGNPISLNKQTVNGHDVPWSEVHRTDHGTPHHHVNPHQHIFEYNLDKGGWIRRGPTIFKP